MPWTAPVTQATDYVVESTDYNAIQNNLAYLYGDAGWTAVSTFTNSWGASGTAPGYILLGRVVYLRGAMTAGTANTAAFTLPVGYRPTFSGIYLCPEAASGTVQAVTVANTGVVTPLLSATTWLSPISFPNV